MTEQLREDLDTFAEEHGYTGRSEVIREACQSLLKEYEEGSYEGQQVLCTVTAVFPYDEPEIEGQMMDIRHEFESSIRSNSHTCLQENAGCVETFVVEGVHRHILKFIGTVRGADESVSVEYNTVPVDSVDSEVRRE